MTCNSCTLANGFGRKMKRKHSRKGKKRHSRRKSRLIANTMDSIKMKRRKMKRSMKRSAKRTLKKAFGSFGPGFSGQTSYPNVYAPYFGSSVPYTNPSEYYLPQTNGKIQSPGMLYNYPGSNFPGN